MSIDDDGTGGSAGAAEARRSAFGGDAYEDTRNVAHRPNLGSGLRQIVWRRVKAVLIVDDGGTRVVVLGSPAPACCCAVVGKRRGPV